MLTGELAESKQTEITIKDVDEMALQTLIGGYGAYKIPVYLHIALFLKNILHISVHSWPSTCIPQHICI